MFGHHTANQPAAGLVMSGHDQHNVIKSPQSNVASGATNFLMINPSLFQGSSLHQTIVDNLPVTLSNSLHNLHQSSGGTVYALTDQQIGIRLPMGVGIKDTSDDHSSSMDKSDSKVDIYSVTDDKGVPGLAGIQFQDGGEQTSPGTPSQTSTSQILHYRPSAKSGDAMLSAINYNDSEMLPEGAFDSCLPNLDDGILSNMGTPGNIRMSENLPDLFDGEGNVNDSYSMEGLSPQPFTDSASGFVPDNNLGSVIDDGMQNPDSNKSDSSKKKSKNKQPKSQGSPGRQTMQCPSCNKTFNNSSALAKHRLTHSDERKYVCNLCQKAFKRQDHLNGHLMTHRDKKPYECNVDSCQKSYCDARSLRRHLENHHNQSPEQIQTAIAAVASNATAIIAAAAASNTASLRATTTETQSMPSTLSVISGASNSHSSQDGIGCSSPYSTPQYSNNSTPMTSPSYSNSGNPQQQTAFFQFDQVPSSASTSHDITLQQRPQQITIQPHVVTQHQSLGLGQLPEGLPVDTQQVQHWQERVQHILTAAANQTGAGHQSNSHSPQGTIEDQSPSYLQQVSPISPVMNHPGSTSPQRIWSANPLTPNTITNDKLNGDDSAKPVVCSICERRFKNIPALNGHMRLHGGYFKKDINKEEKKSKKAHSTSMGSKVSKVSSEPVDISLPTISQAFQTSLETITPPVTAQAAGPVFPSLQSPVATPDTPLDIAHSVIQQLQQHQQQQQIQEQQIQLQQLQQQEQQLQQQLQQQIQQIQMEQHQLQQHLEQQNHQQQEQLQQVPHVQKQQLVLQQQIQQLQIEKQQLTHHLEQQIQQTKLKQQLEDQHLKQQQQSQLQQQQQQFQDILQQHQHSQSGSVPQSPQVPQSPLLQRQVSVESLDYQFQSPPHQDIPSRMSAQLHLQQLARQQQQQQSPRDIIQQMDIGQLAEQLSMTSQQQQQQQQHPQHVLQQLHSPPPASLSSMSIQSNLQSAIAQIPQFALQTPNPHQEVLPHTQTSFVSPSHLSAGQVTLVTTAVDNPELSVAQLLNGIDGIQDPVGTVFRSHTTTTAGLVGGIAGLSSLAGHPNISTLPTTIKEENNLVVTPTLDNTSMSNSYVVSHASGNLHSGAGGATIDLDSAAERLKQEIMEQMANRSLHTESKAADSNPFSFPIIDSFSGNNPEGDLPGSIGGHHNPGGHFEGILGLHGDSVQQQLSIDNSLNAKSETKSIQNRHQELKRRLSVGSEVELLKKSYSSGNQHNIGSKGSTPITYVKHTPSSGPHVKTDSHARPRMRSKSGDDYNLMRANSEDHTFMRPRSRTEDSLWRMKSKSEEYWGSSFSKSDGAGLFRNPNTLSSPIKLKRKHRPAPLFIPPHMNNCGFQSRLRSPRINPHIEGRGNTPPPYTPPPMLSPIRSGSGLFWSMYKPVTPKSAPVTPRSLQLSMSSRASLGHFDQVMKMEEEEEAPPQESEEAAPETDIQPHVNIGSQYQAEIPPFNSSRGGLDFLESKEDLMWDPSFLGDNADLDVQYYQEFACSSAVKGNGANVEYALHILRMANGNIQTAMLMLMSSALRVPRHHSLHSYTYQESEVWSTVEVERYQQALMKCDKDFLSISKEVETKSTGDCVQFYYLWKKVCPDEHKRLRVVRRKREQDQLYNLRTRQQQEQQQQSGPTQVMDSDSSDSDSSSSRDTADPLDKEEEQLSSSSVRSSPVPMFPCEYPECTAAFGSKQALNAHGRIHGSSKNSSPASSRNIENRGPGRPKPNPPPNKTVPAPLPADGSEVFPCKLCGRVFPKVKSRSAHMKIHRLAEADRKPKPNNMEMTIKTILPTGSPNG